MRGLELSRRFYVDAVRPILERRFPDVEHAAALIGSGSEVLDFDDETSTDHHWGPRVQLFVRDLAPAGEMREVLANELPPAVAGYPTNFAPPNEEGTQLLELVDSGPINHRVDFETVAGFMVETIGFDPLSGVGVADWLVTPSQRLLSVTAGEVFVDPIGELSRVRDALAWYPHDVWLLVMAGEWRRISQLEHLMGRAGGRGDELGAGLIAGGLVNALIRLGFLHERRYAPYPKWFGTAYGLLGRPEAAALEAAVATPRWKEREAALVDAYRLVGAAHNELGVTERVDPEPRQFYDRPLLYLDANRFVDALRAAITDPEVRAIEHEAGAVNAVSESTDVLTRPHLWRPLRTLYEPR